jgi:hypothetical protein
MTPRDLSYKAFNLPSHPDHTYIFGLRVGISTIKKFTVEARGHPHPLPEVFLRITHISETIL